MGGPHYRSMSATEDMWQYAAEQGLSEEEALRTGMEEKTRQFSAKGSEIYAQG